MRIFLQKAVKQAMHESQGIRKISRQHIQKYSQVVGKPPNFMTMRHVVGEYLTKKLGHEAKP
jgi:hypothetical protein